MLPSRWTLWSLANWPSKTGHPPIKKKAGRDTPSGFFVFGCRKNQLFQRSTVSLIGLTKARPSARLFSIVDPQKRRVVFQPLVLQVHHPAILMQEGRHPCPQEGFGQCEHPVIGPEDLRDAGLVLIDRRQQGQGQNLFGTDLNMLPAIAGQTEGDLGGRRPAQHLVKSAV